MTDFRTVQEIRDLDDLRDCEADLLTAAQAGEVLRLGRGVPGVGDERRMIRVGIIRYLLLGGADGTFCHERGVRIVGAVIDGRLDLQGCDSVRALSLKNCRFRETPSLQSASLRGVYLDGSHCPGLRADRLRISESMHLRAGFHATGEVRLLGAEIGGNLSCTDGVFENEDGVALHMDRVRTGGSVFLRDGFRARGQVRILGANIGENLECNGAGFTATDQIALHADRLKVGGSAFLQDGFHASGAVRLIGAQIEGNLYCVGGVFSAQGGVALHADRLRVGGSVSLRNGFQATGAVRLVSADIQGSVDCAGASFANPDGDAFNINKARIGGGFLWRGGVSASGDVRLEGATCAELNDDWGDWPEAPYAVALDGFTYKSIARSAVDADTRLRWLALDDVSNGFHPQPYQHLAAVLREMGHDEDAIKVKIAKERLQRASDRDRQRDLIAGAGAALDVAADATSPRTEMPEDFDRERRLYKRQNTAEEDFFRRAYRHAFARPGGDRPTRNSRAGLDPASRALGAEGRRNDMLLQIAAARLRIWGSLIVQYVFDALIGFGYRPMRAVWTIAAMLCFGWWLFAETWDAGDMTPNSPLVLHSAEWTAIEDDPLAAHTWSDRDGRGRDYETFHPLAYSFDVVVPLIDLGQESAWAPSTNRTDWGRAAWWIRWVLKIFGWFVTALGAAAVTVMVRRD